MWSAAHLVKNNQFCDLTKKMTELVYMRTNLNLHSSTESVYTVYPISMNVWIVQHSVRA